MEARCDRPAGRSHGPGEAPRSNADEIVKTLMAFDRNGDGQLNRDELPERMLGLFDHNCILTADEIRGAAQSGAAPAAGGPGEGREHRSPAAGVANSGASSALTPSLLRSTGVATARSPPKSLPPLPNL